MIRALAALDGVIEIELEHSPNCGGKLKIISVILELLVIGKILAHLGLQARAPQRAPARGQALQVALGKLRVQAAPPPQGGRAPSRSGVGPFVSAQAVVYRCLEVVERRYRAGVREREDLAQKHAADAGRRVDPVERICEARPH